jgi:hypothetical protein
MLVTKMSNQNRNKNLSAEARNSMLKNLKLFNTDFQD